VTKILIIWCLLLIAGGLSTLQCLAASGSAQDSGIQQSYVKNQLLVKFKKGVSAEQIARINAEQKTVVIKQMGPLFLIQIPKEACVPEMVNRFSRMPEVEYAEPNYIYSIQK